MVKALVALIVLPSMLAIMLGAVGCAIGRAGGGAPDQDVVALVRRSADANRALVRGDIDGYLALSRARLHPGPGEPCSSPCAELPPATLRRPP